MKPGCESLPKAIAAARKIKSFSFSKNHGWCTLLPDAWRTSPEDLLGYVQIIFFTTHLTSNVY